MARFRYLAVAVGVVVVAAIVFLLRGEPPESAPLDPNPGSSFRIVALGDSFISGQGAQRYFPGTDEPGEKRNMCHRAKTAYPYLLADRLDASLVFVACSGARTWHVTEVGQYPDSGDDVYGELPQVEVLEGTEGTDVVLISIGGNDAGFAEIGMQCAFPAAADCRRQAQEWLERLDSEVYPALVETHTAVRKAVGPEVEVFAMTYPNPLGSEFCNDLAGLSPAEMDFIREVFVGRLNEMVTTAAEAAGIRSIDLTRTLVGHRFCEVALGETAVNFIRTSRTRGAPIDVTKLTGLFSGSMHPNRLGHELMEKKVRRELERLQAGTLPPPPAPDPDKRPPPFVPAELGLPGAPRPFPPGTDCAGSELTTVTLMAALPRERALPLSGLRPGSTVCFRTYRDRWQSKRAGTDGKVEVPIDVTNNGVGSINEILFEEEGGDWKQIVASRFSSGGGA